MAWVARAVELHTMKWLPATGATQTSADGRYLIMEANHKDWIAYALNERADLGTVNSSEDAQAICDSHARAVLAASASLSSPSPP